STAYFTSYPNQGETATTSARSAQAAAIEARTARRSLRSRSRGNVTPSGKLKVATFYNSRRMQPESSAPAAPFLSVAIPGHNEIESIEETASRTRDALEAVGRSYELVLLDDGSTDGTTEAIRRFADGHERCRAIFHPRREGIASVIRACYFETSGEWATWFP